MHMHVHCKTDESTKVYNPLALNSDKGLYTLVHNNYCEQAKPQLLVPVKVHSLTQARHCSIAIELGPTHVRRI